MCRSSKSAPNFTPHAWLRKALPRRRLFYIGEQVVITGLTRAEAVRRLSVRERVEPVRDRASRTGALSRTGNALSHRESPAEPTSGAHSSGPARVTHAGHETNAGP